MVWELNLENADSFAPTGQGLNVNNGMAFPNMGLNRVRLNLLGVLWHHIFDPFYSRLNSFYSWLNNFSEVVQKANDCDLIGSLSQQIPEKLWRIYISPLNTVKSSQTAFKTNTSMIVSEITTVCYCLLLWLLWNIEEGSKHPEKSKEYQVIMLAKCA